MKTYINRDTLELFSIIARSGGGFCLGVAGRSDVGQYQILKSLNLVTELNSLEVTKLTETGEAVADTVVAILRSHAK